MIIFNSHHRWYEHEFEAGDVYTTKPVDEKFCLELLSKLNNYPDPDILKNVNEWFEFVLNQFATICVSASGVFAAANRTASYPV